MKKLNLLFLIIFLGSLLAHTQSLTVTSPRSSDSWEKNREYIIRWTSRRCSSRNVKINIFRNSVSVPNFIEQLTGPNSGSKSWTVPRSYMNGNYVIRIKTDPAEAGCLGDSSIFSIVDSSTPGTEPLTAVLTVNRTIPALVSANLRIDRVVRTSSIPLKAGDPLNLHVYVVNSSNVSANICIATPVGKNDNFYKKGECHVINGNSTNIYAISVPFIRTNLKNGNLKSTVFITDSNKSGSLFKVTWKDENNSNNFHSFSFPYDLPDLIVTRIVRFTHSAIVNNQMGTTLIVEVKNQGTIASTPGKIGVKDNVPGYFGGTCEIKGYVEFDMPSIGPGVIRRGTLKFPCPLVFSINSNYDGYRDGHRPSRSDFWIEVFANSSNSIIESNLTNNKLRVNGDNLNPGTTNRAPTGYSSSW